MKGVEVHLIITLLVKILFPLQDTFLRLDYIPYSKKTLEVKKFGE